MLIFILLLSAGWTLAYVEHDIEQAEFLFEKFIKDFNRNYKDNEEKQMRFNIFKERLLEINEHNKRHGYNVMGINLFADMSKEEFRSTHLGCLLDDSNGSPCSSSDVLLRDVLLGDVPESFDWRDKGMVSPVKNQAKCGACWAFSTIGNIESQYAIKHGSQNLIRLSEQQLVDCDRNKNNGCHGGLMERTISHLINVGVMAESDYPYTQSDNDQCAFDKNKVKVNVTGCLSFTGASEEDIKSILVSMGPLTIALAAGPFMSYESGVFAHCDADADIDHALLLVGYGTDEKTKKPYWIIKNSWGSDFGENGYLRIIRGNPNCVIGRYQLATSQVV